MHILLLGFSESKPDSRGMKFAEEIDASNFVVLNENIPTRKTKNTVSSPDINLATSSFAMSPGWNC